MKKKTHPGQGFEVCLIWVVIREPVKESRLEGFCLLRYAHSCNWLIVLVLREQYVPSTGNNNDFYKNHRQRWCSASKLALSPSGGLLLVRLRTLTLPGAGPLSGSTKYLLYVE